MSLTARLQVIRYALMSGIADFSVIYTWKTWTLGWLSRVLAQVAFFAVIGLLLNDENATRHLLIGNAVVMVAVEAFFVCASTVWERQAGTLPLLVAAPASALLTFTGRSLFWVGSGTATASVALFALSPVFGIPLPMPAALLAVPLILLVGLSTYCFGLVLSGIVLRFMEARNVVSNVAHLSVMALCGVQVPVTFWPGWVQAVASVLPVNHGLAAIRGLLDGVPAQVVITQAALEVAVGAGWFAVAALTFRHFVEQGRKDGSIEFGG
ncbi:ABC transporter permease [Lentzea sp. NPDC006480]|uniref:ABC transporter permease n=1 Tax=Lentzea sp. NPDC006480 TaxID=3157176 RepID=UPI0033AF62DF